MTDPTLRWKRALGLVSSLLLMLWLVEAANTLTDHQLNVFGIYPRELAALPGLFFWPLLHANFQHLIMNTTPLAVLGFFVALRGASVFVRTCLVILLVGGLGVWLFGRPAFHIGASGLVFGFFGFLVAVSFYEKSLSALGIASFAILYYGGLIWGVLPSDSFVSWEAHLFGLMAGVLAARLPTVRRG